MMLGRALDPVPPGSSDRAGLTPGQHVGSKSIGARSRRIWADNL